MSINAGKPIYLLAGGRGSKYQEHIIKSVFKDIGKPKPVIAYVGVANGDDWGFYLMISGLIKSGGSCQIERVLIAPKKADLSKARKDLETADAIFMSGGDVEAGMQVLQEKNLTGFFTELSKQNKVFFGASAGSIMLAKEWVRWRNPDDDSTAELFPCLGIAPVICDTHAEEDDWEELKAALNLGAENTRGYGIRSGSCLKVYPDGKVEALGGAVAQYLKQVAGITKQADLSPI
jgi:peptidase E